MLSYRRICTLKEEVFMTKRAILTAIFVIAVAVSQAAEAEELCQIQAKSLHLGDVSGGLHRPGSGLSPSGDSCRPRQHPRSVREHSVAWAKGCVIDSRQRESRCTDDRVLAPGGSTPGRDEPRGGQLGHRHLVV
jgi:hypothetical protein